MTRKKKKQIHTILADTGLVCGKGPGEMAAITSTVNVQVKIQILAIFLIPSFERRFSDVEVFFQDDNVHCH